MEPRTLPPDCRSFPRVYGRTMRVHRLVVAAAVVVGLATGVPAGERAPSGPAQPLLLRLEGVIATTADEARGKGFTVTSLGFAGDDAHRWLAVTEARTFGGDQSLDGKDVLALVDPFTPNFLVAGPTDLVARLRDLRPGTAVRIEGLVSRSSRTLYLRRVEPLA
jgi:hypothetical protein